MYKLALVIFASLVIAGCSEQQPLMTMPQQKTYNECMKDRWSGAADTLIWGPFGWAYYNSVRNDCIAKSGAIGTEEAAGSERTTSSLSPANAQQPSSNHH